mmetsp:Transcript_146005/g.266026  ORF Transcript_146005/g.266026 Transcript_146005/m.266026 type:complete len:263 (+) Transcript_146005:2-790(+)
MNARPLSGQWQFQESVNYLRNLGALDESEPKDPRVIIPNYLMSPSNCIASSSFYSVCCMDECEALMGHLEEQIGAPEAPPSRLATLVANLPSSSIKAPRTLSSTLLTRLDEIATNHDGAVLIHGRLFAQWMHHAFPRECPYPHVSGTTNPQTADEWEAEGRRSTASKFEMMQYSRNSKKDEKVPQVNGAPSELQLQWSPEEELLIGRRSPFSEPASDSAWTNIRNLMLVAALGSVLVGLVRTSKSVQPESQKKGFDSHAKFV